MKKATYLLTIAYIFLISQQSYAQGTIEDNSVVRSALDSMFETLDKSRVPTGLLQDYAVDLVGLENYNGTILADALQNAEGAEHTFSSRFNNLQFCSRKIAAYSICYNL